MIATTLAALTSRLAGPIASGLALLFLALALTQCAGKSVQTHRADRAEAALDAARTDLTRCQGNARTLEASIRAQNAAVDALRTEGDRRAAEAAKAISEAAKGRASAEARAAKLLKTPPTGIDACARAMSAFDAVKGSLR